jgi:hypothetical protein
MSAASRRPGSVVVPLSAHPLGSLDCASRCPEGIIWLLVDRSPDDDDHRSHEVGGKERPVCGTQCSRPSASGPTRSERPVHGLQGVDSSEVPSALAGSSVSYDWTDAGGGTLTGSGAGYQQGFGADGPARQSAPLARLSLSPEAAHRSTRSWIVRRTRRSRSSG